MLRFLVAVPMLRRLIAVDESSSTAAQRQPVDSFIAQAGNIDGEKKSEAGLTFEMRTQLEIWKPAQTNDR